MTSNGSRLGDVKDSGRFAGRQSFQSVLGKRSGKAMWESVRKKWICLVSFDLNGKLDSARIHNASTVIPSLSRHASATHFEGNPKILGLLEYHYFAYMAPPTLSRRRLYSLAHPYLRCLF